MIKPMTFIRILSLLLPSCFAFGQAEPPAYKSLIKKADTFYRTKNYKNSALTYTQAFRSVKWKGSVNDHYNAACSWALADVPDSAFSRLNYIAVQCNYINLEQLNEERDLISLHRDKRWKSLVAKVKDNIEQKEAKMNKPLISQLALVYKKDQMYRGMIDSVQQQFGNESKEIKMLWRTIHETDSVNLIVVKKILDTEGWLGADVISEDGNATLFFVIQHADQKTQEYYLPMMRDAVKIGNANASALALLEDRVALGQGKKQIFGSQILQDSKTGKHSIAPIEDEKNVDKRRASVGLGPLSEYVKNWGIVYGAETKKAENSKKIINDGPLTAIEIHDSIAGPFNVTHGFGKTKDFDLHTTNRESSWYAVREENSAWFKFSFGFDTTLVFDIVPDDYQEDYDFALFKDSGEGFISRIASNEQKAERLCYSVNEQKNGSTGLAEYGTKNLIGIGNGSGYVAAMPVKKGETYYLMITYSDTYLNYYHKLFPKGFMIYFYNYWPKKPEYLKHPPQKTKAITLENVLFETDKSVLQATSFTSLDKLVNILQANKTMKIEIRGYTDDSGDEKRNQRLSEERALAVMNYLISKKITKDRLSSKGFGSTQPVAKNDTEQGRVKNRRVEFLIIKQ